MRMSDRKQIMEFDKKLTDEAEMLNSYLNQYKDCIEKKKMLEYRREEIRKEFNQVKSPRLDGMPRAGIRIGEGGAAAIVYRLDEIETKINEQINRATKSLSDIMNIIDFLQENSLERSIIENRYIDRMDWNKVCKENHAGKSKAKRYWKKGLYDLLEFKKVRQILIEYRGAKDVRR